MNEGEVYCLDTVSEKFVSKNGQYQIAKVNKFSLVDISDGWCVSVSVRGEGCCHQVSLVNKNDKVAV
jgi:hypothetical protein